MKALLLLVVTRGEHALVTGSSITAEDLKKIIIQAHDSQTTC